MKSLFSDQTALKCQNTLRSAILQNPKLNIKNKTSSTNEQDNLNSAVS